MELILGTAGQPHVTSQQMREIFKMVVGSGSYILNSGEYIEPELQSNQALRIRSGILMHHGGIAEVKQNTYDEVTIGNGTQGMKRIDLVVARYTKDPETEHETMTWVVIQGTPAASDPEAPAYTEGDMQNGDLTDDCPVFEVHLDGIQVTEVVKLVEILDCDLSSLNGKMTGAFIASDIETAVASGVRGGWKRVGDIVFVDVKFNLVASYKDAVVMRNLPAPRNDRAVLAAANMSATRSAFGLVGTGGELAWHDSSQPATGNECSITGIYNCV